MWRSGADRDGQNLTLTYFLTLLAEMANAKQVPFVPFTWICRILGPAFAR